MHRNRAILVGLWVSVILPILPAHAMNRDVGPVPARTSAEISLPASHVHQKSSQSAGAAGRRITDTGDVQRLRDCLLVATGWNRPAVGKQWAMNEDRPEERRRKYLLYLRGVEAERRLYGMPRKQLRGELYHLLARLTPGTVPYACVAWVLASRGVYARGNVDRFLTVYSVHPHPADDPWARVAWPIEWYELAVEDVPGALVRLYQMSPHPRILEVILNPREIFADPRRQMDQLWYPWAHAVRELTMENPDEVMRLAAESDVRRTYLATFWGYSGLMSGLEPPQRDRERARKVLRPYLEHGDPAIRTTARKVFYAMQKADREVAKYEREFQERRRKAKAPSG